MNKSESARKWLVTTALSYLGTPYIWGGDDPSGFDCSGFVIECLKSVGLLTGNEDYTSASLLRKFCDGNSKQIIQRGQQGLLVFYIDHDSHAYHVGLCLDEFFQISARGGGRTVTSLRKSWRDNAFVKIRPIGVLSEQVRIIDPFLKL